MYTKQPKKLLIMNILDILRRYSDADHRLSQKDIIDILKRDYEMEADRKAIRRNILDLIENGKIDLIVNSPAGKSSKNDDSYLRKAAIKAKSAENPRFATLKIGIMGCIVNGPGEMADADYGYVGAGPGKISLYKNKVCVEKSIPEANAVEKLIEFIENDK